MIFVHLIFCSLVSGGALAASLPTILDEQPYLSIEEILDIACQSKDGYKHQISRMSTMRNLADFLSTRMEWDGDHYLQCKDENQDALNQLKLLIDASPNDVCSDDKISLIEDYHANHISTIWDNVLMRQDKNKRLAPKLIAMFFMHYAVEVGAICKRNLIPNLEELSSRSEQLLGDDREYVDKLMSGVFPRFKSLTSVNSYDDIVLIWDMLENAVSDEVPDEAVDEATGEPIKMMAKVKSSGPMIQLQNRCRHKLRPIYSQVILPIVRLSNLGYLLSADTEEDLEKLRASELVRNWYGLTQICEAIIPIKFFEDESMGGDGTIAIITGKEAEILAAKSTGNEIPREVKSAPQQLELRNNIFDDIDLIGSVLKIEDQALLKKYQTNLSVKDRIFRRVMVKFANELRQKIRNMAGKIFFSAKKDEDADKRDDFEQQDMAEMVSKSLSSVSEDELMSMDGGLSKTHRPFERRRRRRRPIDAKTDLNKRISYMHTKSWSDMFARWKKQLTPTEPPTLRFMRHGVVIMFALSVVLFLILSTVLICAIVG